MSWDSYVDTLKSYSQNGAISEGIICGKDNGGLWTTPTENLTVNGKSTKFTFSPICLLMKGMRNERNFKKGKP